MVENSPQADEKVNELYLELRNKHGEGNSKANGYLWHGYFLREQKLLFSLLESLAPPESAADKNDRDKLAANKRGRILLDVGCGSGLMRKACQDLRRVADLDPDQGFHRHQGRCDSGRVLRQRFHA